jgi:hypothetical protein
MMKRTFGAVLLTLACVTGGDAAVKSYQFTGVVKTVDASSMTVEKSAKETWQFEIAKETKGATVRVGDRVTVYYKMVATEIEPKPAAAATKK